MATTSHHIKIGDTEVGNDLPLTIIAGPCQMENRGHALDMAGALADISKDLDIDIIYKTSFDKANRTSMGSPRGLGLDEAIPVFAEIKKTTGLATLTDVHMPEQCAPAAGVVDVLQIPAFLCRQTDLLLAAAATGRAARAATEDKT